MTLGAPQDCQKHAYAEGVYCGNSAASQKVVTVGVAQKLVAKFPNAVCEEVLPVGEEAANLVGPLFGRVRRCGVTADGLVGGVQLVGSFCTKMTQHAMYLLSAECPA